MGIKYGGEDQKKNEIIPRIIKPALTFKSFAGLGEGPLPRIIYVEGPMELLQTSGITKRYNSYKVVYEKGKFEVYNENGIAQPLDVLWGDRVNKFKRDVLTTAKTRSDVAEFVDSHKDVFNWAGCGGEHPATVMPAFKG